MKIATYNIRIDNMSDWGYKSWRYRKKGVANIILDNDIDIVAVQEVANNFQKKSLLNLLKNYDYYGMGRDSNNGKSGEQTGILYNKHKFTLIQKGDFFLSETPDIKSKGWDAKYIKKTVWALFFDNETYKIFFVFNTHLDSTGIEAMNESINLIYQKIKDITRNNKKTPTFLLGDFNINVNSPDNLYEKINNKYLKNTYKNANTIINNVGTANRFNDNEPDITETIDYIFTNTKVNTYETCTYKYKEHFPSDHLPIIITCNL